MLKITSFSALIIGLLLAAPLVFSNAEAGRSDMSSVAAKSDRESVDSQMNNRLAAAFRLVDVCSPGVTGDAASWCTAHQAELSDPATGKATLTMMTIESRDEAAQTSTLAAVSTTAQ